MSYISDYEHGGDPFEYEQCCAEENRKDREEHGEICDDNRLKIVDKYRRILIGATNIETSPDEMKVLDDILFRFWQMGWLDTLEKEECCNKCKYLYPLKKFTKDGWEYSNVCLAFPLTEKKDDLCYAMVIEHPDVGMCEMFDREEV